MSWSAFVDWLKTGKVYASRAYTSLVGWIITIGTFAMVFYDDMVEALPFMMEIFPNSFVFMAVSIPIGLAFLAKLGKWDWKQGTFPKEGATAFQNNPEWVDHRAETNDRIDAVEAKIDKVDAAVNDILHLLLEEE